jgi:hypothetical protein
MTIQVRVDRVPLPCLHFLFTLTFVFTNTHGHVLLCSIMFCSVFTLTVSTESLCHAFTFRVQDCWHQRIPVLSPTLSSFELVQHKRLLEIPSCCVRLCYDLTQTTIFSFAKPHPLQVSLLLVDQQ